MLKRLFPLALLCVCLFAGPAGAGREENYTFFGTDYESAYNFADLAYELGYDVRISYTQSTGNMGVWTPVNSADNWYYPLVCFTWTDLFGNPNVEYLPYPDKPSIFP